MANDNNVQMFGKTFNAVGTPTNNLLLRTKGDLKIQWGNKFIDLIKDGKINNSSDFKVNIVDSVDEIELDGMYLLNSDGEQAIICHVNDTNFELYSTQNQYLSYSNEQSLTADQRLQAQRNIGMVYSTLEDIQGIQSGIVYVVETNKLYTITEGKYSEYVSNQEVSTQPSGAIVLYNSESEIPSGWEIINISNPPEGYIYIIKV